VSVVVLGELVLQFSLKIRGLLAMAICCGFTTSHASFPCQQKSSGEAAEPALPPAHWRQVLPDRDPIKSDGYLLGTDGSRVQTHSNLIQLLQLENNVMQSEPLWMDRVDWSVYHKPANQWQPTPILYFDTDEKGVSHICRIDRREPTPAYQERRREFLATHAPGHAEKESASTLGEPPADFPVLTRADVETTSVQQLGYDQGGHVVSEEIFERDEENGTWSIPAARCLARRASGAVTKLTKLNDGRCVDAKPTDASERYVYDAGDRLQRKITTEFRVEHRGERYETVASPLVNVYDETGKVYASYHQDADGSAYRLPEVLAWKEGDAQLPEILVVNSPVLTDDFFAQNKSNLLAQGKVAKVGLLNVTVSQQKEIWSVMQSNENLVLLDHPNGTLVFAPRIANPVMVACMEESPSISVSCR
jgi:hypothetical protein